jgi:hypothetical protein
LRGGGRFAAAAGLVEDGPMDGSVKRQAALAVTISMVVAAVLLAAQLVVNAKQVDMGVLTRDVAAQADLKWYTGFFSNLGLMAWGGAVALGGFGWWQFRGDARTRALAAALGAYAALSAFLGLDDMAQLHEDVIPGHLGISEKYVYVAEALMFLAFMVLNRRVLLRHAPVILVAALAGFGASVLADLVDNIWSLPIVIEDGAKLMGICNWVGMGAVLLAAGVGADAEA